MKPIATARLAPIQLIPLFGSKVTAGFPSPADDFVESELDLNEHLIKRKTATYFFRVKGNSMTGANINNGDLLIVDRTITPKHGQIVVAAVNGDLTVKRLYKQRGEIRLQAANDDYPDITIKEDGELTIWGVVLHVVHTF